MYKRCLKCLIITKSSRLAGYLRLIHKVGSATPMLSSLVSECCQNITLDPRLPFPDSVGGIFPGAATTQGIEWFSQLAGLQWLTVLSMLIRGITTLTGDWHSGRLAALYPSIMLRNSLLTEGINSTYFCPGNVTTHTNYVSALKHKCNVMICCPPLCHFLARAWLRRS